MLRNHICYMCMCLAVAPRICTLCKQVYCKNCLLDALDSGIEKCKRCRKPTIRNQFPKIGPRQSKVHYDEVQVICCGKDMTFS